MNNPQPMLFVALNLAFVVVETEHKLQGPRSFCSVYESCIREDQSGVVKE